MRYVKLISLIAAALMLTACSATAGNGKSGVMSAASPAAEASPTAEVSPGLEASPGLETSPTAEPDSIPTEAPAPETAGTGAPETDYGAARRSAYADALENLLNNRVLPGGETVDLMGSMEDNQFGVFDADLDGEDELVILYSSTYMAGMVGKVYGYDGEKGAMIEELSEFPALRFYDNGAVTADWSHNQGLAGEFWPYTIYEYNAGTGVYECKGSVDAWQKKYFETDFEGNAFPDDIDADRDGFVYYLMTDAGYGDPVDGAEYESWRDKVLAGAKEITVNWLDLTEDNIKSVR